MKKGMGTMARKGMYSIISGFLFVIIAVVLVLGVIYYEVFITEMENMAKDDLNRYEVARDAKNRVHFCFGNVIDPDLFNETCEIPLVKGYSIHRYNLSGCTNMTWDPGNVTHYEQRFSYAVPVKENGSICLGELAIFN